MHLAHRLHAARDRAVRQVELFHELLKGALTLPSYYQKDLDEMSWQVSWTKARKMPQGRSQLTCIHGPLLACLAGTEYRITSVLDMTDHTSKHCSAVPLRIWKVIKMAERTFKSRYLC